MRVVKAHLRLKHFEVLAQPRHGIGETGATCLRYPVGHLSQNKPTLYLSPETGELVSRRHELWRIFDFVWMLHIMDYEERENVNNWVLRTFTWAAVAMALSGAWLLLYNLPRRKRRKVRP